ncbi:hypothetical protein JI739_05360 [Ramlibacter sp. AW1]|uniref:Uncharacterized protein n=1 Tax=Ramlibacter aurantiacus TaxID=2801330 RepID=A0A936ZF40_9BURK|nr:hypothetical protein [Ramlibacter aurantiacus]MBL0419772.1 hypothetical protein [Ramlibacter aurantiacus]
MDIAVATTQKNSKARRSATTRRARVRNTASVLHPEIAQPKQTAKQKAISAVKSFVEERPLMCAGVAAAAGFACLAVGAMRFREDMVAYLVVKELPKVLGAAGAGAGASLGLYGSAGVAIAGIAFGVPALAVSALGAWTLGQLGVAAGDVLASVFGSSIWDIVADLGWIGLGLLLIGWAADRVARNNRVAALVERARAAVREFAQSVKDAWNTLMRRLGLLLS